MNNQFVKLYTELLDRGLNANEAVAYSLIHDRMQSSVQRADFLDKKEQAYYVIYTHDELAEKLHISVRTASKIIGKLVKMELIRIKRQFNKASKIFIDGFEVAKNDTHAEISTPFMQNLHVNHTDLKQTNYTDNTVNTVSDVKTAPVVSEIDNWVKTTHEVVKLTVPTLNSIREFCNNNVEKCKYVVRLVLNARNSIARKHGLVKSELSQFESNKNLQNGLFEQLSHIFSYVKKNGFKQYAGYVTNALKDYFKDAMGLSKGVKVIKPDMQQVKFDDDKKHIKEELPDWAKEDYVYTPDEHVDEKQKAEVQAMLAEI
ncbi:winged helix-turn-helix transcriptional regulator [Apilactobacillus xinyiensis]|uniref:winged helix-turn-helix transcriptional regulator n=1 Tax=Apilactobacillus xinyiensis TaxID=2841032 RepID=UPI00200F9665|nr:winged helix-turn-helix transcriptional regulator [Apilactobacillus xinyiensis]MCL0330553.1 winged helix-turn-helix domain-containing protein [Apilactobacillus xinyiensis]